MKRDYLNENTEPPQYKIIMMGSSGAGKSSLLRRWAHKIFSAEYKAPIGVDFRTIRCGDGEKEVKLQFWDMSAHEIEFNKPLTDSYCDGAVAVCLMWDSGKAETYQDLPGFLDVIQDKLSLETPIIFVAGKVDLPLDDARKKALSKQESEIENKARKAGFKTVACVRTSAKDEIGFKELESTLLKTIDALIEASKIPEPTTPDIPLTIKKNEYEPTPYRHTRQVRYQHLLEIINSTVKGALSRKERVWMEMNLLSINDANSQTSRLIKAFLEENPEESSPSISKNLPKEDHFARQFYEAQDLLDRMSEQETQIFGFKLILSIFEETRKVQRAQHHIEIERLYEKARKIYDAMLPEHKATDIKSIANSNNDQRERGSSLYI